MTITTQTPLRTTETHGTEDQAKASLVQPDAKDLEAVHALWQLAPTVGIDPCITVSQCFEEMGGPRPVVVIR